MFVKCLVKAILYVTTCLKMFGIAYFSKFMWEGFFWIMWKNSNFYVFFIFFLIYKFYWLPNCIVIVISQFRSKWGWKIVTKRKKNVKIDFFSYFAKKHFSHGFWAMSNTVCLYISSNIWDCLYETILKYFACWHTLIQCSCHDAKIRE